MAQSKINELEFPRGRGGGCGEGNQLSSTPISSKGKPCLLLPKHKKLLSLFHSRALTLPRYPGML